MTPKCYNIISEPHQPLDIKPKCNYADLSQLGDKVSQHCTLISKRIEDLPDGIYHIEIKDGKITTCPLKLW